MPIVWTRPDGEIEVTYILPHVMDRERREGESTADLVLRLAGPIQAAIPRLNGANLALIPTKDIPVDREDRYKWRVMEGQVKVDEAIPDLPDPQDILIDQLVAKIKQVEAEETPLIPGPEIG
jgi:hypothetical protein